MGAATTSSRRSAGIGTHIGIATPPVWKFGTDDQKGRYLVVFEDAERVRNATGDAPFRRAARGVCHALQKARRAAGTPAVTEPNPARDPHENWALSLLRLIRRN
ncbi:MAG: acyl-CoA dehydrogenase family protein [Actinomycetota bacterium]|nr:acyl-CoA dehydrogenase family protein [Actinomycetota bacterium]